MQVFAPDLSDNRELPIAMADVPAGDWRTVELLLPSVAGVLRVRPVNGPAVIELREISVHSGKGGMVWAASTLPELQNLSIAGPLIVLPGKDACLFFSFGSDPAWLLPALQEPAASVTLKVVLLIHKSFEAVSEAITAAYAEVGTMAAQVRTASAERNQTLRDFQRQAQAVEADRDRALRNWEEQVKFAQLESQRNTDLQAQRDALALELEALRAEQEALRQTLLAWQQSLSWRMTRPLRSASAFTKNLRKNFD